MATLRNKKKLAAVSRETPEGSRSSRGQNVFDPELTQDYISQVSEGIEGRVTKKLSKEFNKTESRILGALSKLDEFLLNPQVRTCSVAVQGTSRNANLDKREIHGDHSSNDPYPEVGYFPHHSRRLNNPETENNSHMVTENYPHKAISKFSIHHRLIISDAFVPRFPRCLWRRYKRSKSRMAPVRLLFRDLTLKTLKTLAKIKNFVFLLTIWGWNESLYKKSKISIQIEYFPRNYWTMCSKLFPFKCIIIFIEILKTLNVLFCQNIVSGFVFLTSFYQIIWAFDEPIRMSMSIVFLWIL